MVRIVDKNLRYVQHYNFTRGCMAQIWKNYDVVILNLALILGFMFWMINFHLPSYNHGHPDVITHIQLVVMDKDSDGEMRFIEPEEIPPGMNGPLYDFGSF